MAGLDFGIHYSCQSPEREWASVYRATLEQAREAESLGFSAISVAEHHFLDDGWVPDPMTMLGALAAVTDDVALGTNIVILPLHHPVAVAERAAMLDLLSNGQFRLGVGIGWRDEEFDAFGVDKASRVRRVEEGLELVRRLLTEEDVTYEGEVYAVEDLTVMPRPVQASVPLWYGGQSPPAIRRAARLADAWSMSPIETRSELAESVATYDAALEDAGRDPDDVHRPLRREAFVAEDDETAWERVGPSLLYEYRDVYGDYEDIGHAFAPGEHEDALEELRAHAADRFVIGGPETVVDELARYRETVGMDEVLLRLHFPGMDPETSADAMRLVAEEVMPAFED